jgi:hypothetical protein
MAGFDFEIRATPRQRTVLARLLRLLQDASKEVSVELRFRWHPSEYRVSVNGPLIAMQMLAAEIGDVTRTHLASTRPRLAAPERARLALRVTDGYVKALCENATLVADIARQFGGTPMSLFLSPGGRTHVAGRLRAFSQLAALFCVGKVNADQMTEECHTVAMLLLKNAVPRNNRGTSFRDLVERACQTGVLSKSHREPLLRLNRLRRRAKHQGQSIPSKIVPVVIFPVISALHELAFAAQRRQLSSALPIAPAPNLVEALMTTAVDTEIAPGPTTTR